MDGQVSLRGATIEDELFLFQVQRIAMKPVSEVSASPILDEKAAFEEYKKKFNPSEIEVIVYDGLAVGRLRVVRSTDSIYVGGIQILPDYQRRGIGSFIFSQLITESKATGLPITLEVHEVNDSARVFYTKLGFTEEARKDNKIHLIYKSKDHPN